MFEEIPVKLRMGAVVFLALAFYACISMTSGPVLSVLHHVLGTEGTIVRTLLSSSLP